jgi:hypothetical protein
MLDRICGCAIEAYRLAQENSYGTMACAAARKLAWHYWDTGHRTQARRWHDVAQSWIVKGQFSCFAGDLYGLEAEMLIGDGKFADAEDALEKATCAWSHSVHSRWKAGQLATRCAIWFARGEFEKIEASISEYRALVLLVADEGGSDVIAARYFQLLCDLGHNREAADDLRRYLARRSHKGLPDLPGLSALVERCSLGEKCKAAFA